MHQWCTYNTAHKTSAQLWHHIAAEAARWGYEQGGAANEVKLQKARDEELEACCEWLRRKDISEQAIAILRADRRPKHKSQADKAIQALKALEQLCDTISLEWGFGHEVLVALEQLRKLTNHNE